MATWKVADPNDSNAYVTFTYTKTNTSNTVTTVAITSIYIHPSSTTRISLISLYDGDAYGALLYSNANSYSSAQTISVSINKTYTRGTSASTSSLYASYFVSAGTAIAVASGSMSVSIPVKAYTISYNANGGTGAPSAQTKTHGTALTLSSTKPTRTGYTFKNWNTQSNGSGTGYASGGSYTANAAATLYAQWTPKTYTVSFNANGGVSAPSSVTKTYGQSVTLPTSKPTRIGHTFLGWAATSSATSAKWLAGGSYSEAITANTTLYAVWRDDYTKPTISSLSVFRCDENGQNDDEGTYATVRAVWSIDTTIDQNVTNTATVTGTIKPEDGTAASFSFTSGGSGTSGTALALISNLDVDTQYTVSVTVTDVKGYTTRNALLLRAFYIMDFGHEGTAIGIGRAAPQSGLEVGYKATFDDDVDMLKSAHVVQDLIIGEGTQDTSLTYGLKYRKYNATNQGGYSDGYFLRIRPSADNASNGDAVLIGSGGLTIVGAGESSANYFDANPHSYAPTTEVLVLSADSKVLVVANGNTASMANAKEWEFSTAGNLICPEAGNVRTQKGNVWIQRDDVLNTETSRSANAYQNFGFKDKDDNYYAAVQGTAYTDGRKAISVFARANDGTSNVDNSVALSVKPDGTRSVTVTSPLAWRNAIVPNLGELTSTDVSTAVSVATSSAKTIASVTLDAGYYVVSYSAIFASNATGRRLVGISNTTNTTPTGAYLRTTLVSQNADSGGSTYLHTSCILHPTSSTTYYLVAWQNSGSALNVTGSLRTIRIN